jgi:hypothetical protein
MLCGCDAQSCSRSYHLQFPLSLLENVNADEREQDLGYQYRVIRAIRPDMEFHTQDKGQRQLHDPIHKKVDACWCPCIARSIEGLHNDLTVGPIDELAFSAQPNPITADGEKLWLIADR